ncbi:MAG: hypothetical protein CR997_00875 [Acidobacteria bacterium]|nr:MAG: hypothetical protein CR997_00875 [Acidobacteriota bacterium]
MAENNRERDKSTHEFRPKEKTRYADVHGSVTDDFLKRRQAGQSADSEQEKTSAGNAQKRGSEEAAFNPGERSVYVDAQGSVTEEILKRQQQKAEGYFVEGEQIGGFTVISRLGEGASGTVYKVKNRLGDIEALKIAPPELLGSSAARKNFMRELKVARELYHPHLVPIYTVDKTTDTDDVFFTMKYMEGGDLDTLLEHNRKRLPPAEVLKWMGQVAQALSFIHARNLVHQDIKPANILIDAFGLTLYTLLSGEFVQINPDPLSEFMDDKVLADQLDRLLNRCWKKDPKKRFKNGSELLAAWPSTAGATPPPPPKQSSRQGDLAISTSHDADIYLDGKSRGQTEGRYLLIEKIPYGEHQLRAENRTQIAEKTFKQDKEIVQVDLELQVKTGRLKVSSKIGFFNFSIQGTSYKAPKVLTNVSVGEHELNISHKELKFSRKIQVKANQTAEFLLTREMLKQEKQRADEKAIANLLAAAPESIEGKTKLLADLQSLAPKVGTATQPQLRQTLERLKKELSDQKRRQQEEAQRQKAEEANRVCRQALEAPEGNLAEKQSKHERLVKSSSNLQAGELKDRAEYEISRLAQEIRRAQQRREEEAKKKSRKRKKTLLRMAITLALVLAVVGGYVVLQEQLRIRQDQQKRRAEAQAWQEAEGDHSIEGYESYLEKMGKAGAHYSEAIAKKEELEAKKEELEEKDHEAYAEADKAGTEEALRAYMANYELHTEEAKSRLSKLQANREQKKARDEEAWERAKKGGSLSSYQAYLDKVGTSGAYYVQAQEKVNELEADADHKAFITARKVGTRVALRNYLSKYKLHASEAKDQLSELELQAKREQEKRRDEEAWRRAKASDTLTSYQSYVEEQGTKGAYYRKAKAKLKELRLLESKNQQSELQAGSRKSFRIPGTTIDLNMRWIPSDSFTMGSNEYYDEKPRHKVTLSKGFWMLETEVTQEMWDALMGPESNRSEYKGAKRPVENVSWNDAKKFIEKLNRKGIGTYRLPTEAEWEYACRAGSTSAYCYGDSKSRLKDYAWYEDNSGGETHEVGGKQSNDWGLYDMHGNVWEWCEDRYGKDYYKESPERDPRGPGPASGEDRVNRGGSCWIDAGRCRSASRDGFAPDYRYWNLGFRLVRNYP